MCIRDSIGQRLLADAVDREHRLLRQGRVLGDALPAEVEVVARAAAGLLGPTPYEVFEQRMQAADGLAAALSRAHGPQSRQQGPQSLLDVRAMPAHASRHCGNVGLAG